MHGRRAARRRHVRKPMFAPVLSVLLLGLITVLWSMHEAQVQAGSITGGVSVSLIVETSTPPAPPPQTGNQQGSTSTRKPSGSLRPISRLLRIWNNTFTAPHPRQVVNPATPLPPPAAHPASGIPAMLPALPDTDIDDAAAFSKGIHNGHDRTVRISARVSARQAAACRMHPFGAPCDPQKDCTLRSLRCILLGINNDMYAAGTSFFHPASNIVEWVRRESGSDTAWMHLFFLLSWMGITLLLLYLLLRKRDELQRNRFAPRRSSDSTGNLRVIHSPAWHAVAVAALLMLMVLTFFFVWETTRAQVTVGISVIGTDILRYTGNTRHAHGLRRYRRL